MNRQDVLDAASQAINIDRAATYGDAQETMERIAKSWSAKLGIDISAVDVCILLADMKLCRASGGQAHDDNFIDTAGYAALGAEIADITPNSNCPRKPPTSGTHLPPK